MKRETAWILTLSLAFALIITGCHRASGLQPVFSHGRPAPDLVVQVWLSKSCSVGQKNDLEIWMRRYRSQLTPLLKVAFEDGPPPPEKENVAKEARLRLARLKRDVARLGLAEREIALIRDKPELAYVEQSVADYVAGYKSAALSGLGILMRSEPKAKQFLEKVAANRQSTFQTTARVILNPRVAR